MRLERSFGAAFWLAGLVWAADMATKGAVVVGIEYGASHEWLPVLNIVHVLNQGAAFSFLHDAGGWQRSFFIAIALAVSAFLVVLIRRPGTSRHERLAYGLIIGGALANMTDRILRGAVVDWIDLHYGAWHWPAFNIADIGITSGAVLLIAHEFFGTKQVRRVDDSA